MEFLPAARCKFLRCRCAVQMYFIEQPPEHTASPQGRFIGALQTAKWHQTHTPTEVFFVNAAWNVATLRQNSRGLPSNQARNRLFSCSLWKPQTMHLKSSRAQIQRWTIQKKKKPLKRSPTVTKDKEHGRGVPGKHQTPLYPSKLGFHHSRHNLFCKDYEYKWNLLQIIDAVSSE